MGITETIVDFSKLASDHQQQFFETMLAFDQQIFPDSSKEDFYDFVYDIDAVSVQVIHYYHNGQLIGQNIIPILKLSLKGQPIFVMSSRAGILPGYRKRNRTLKSAVRVAINYRIKHPTTPLWFVPTVMQPKIYTLFASRSQNFFPRSRRSIPEEYLQVLEMVQQRKKEVEKRREDIFVHPSLMPYITPAHIKRLRINPNKHINFFMQHVPDYFVGKGLLCVCKLDLKTILETIWNLSLDRHVY